VTSNEAQAQAAPDKPASRSRRSLLTAAAAVGGALAAGSLGRVPAASAANGDGLKVGQVHAGTQVTEVRNTAAVSTAVGLKGFVTTTVPGGATAGVWGQSNAQNGSGVFGIATNTGGGTKGVYGRSTNGTGVVGEATATSGANVGVFGRSASPAGNGIRGSGGTGVLGTGTTYGVRGSGGPIGVHGVGSSMGVFGKGYDGSTFSGGVGVAGESITGPGVSGFSRDLYGIVGNSPNGYAGWFAGKTQVVGAFAATSKNFVIDHPQDPANKTLTHSCVEAPEMLNVYRGNVTLDANGRATVRMPGYFRALNRDYSYQLTPVGAEAPGLNISRKIERNSFGIAGGMPGQEVCWMVTGVRQDAWAAKHPLRVERTKKPKDRGKYLTPEAFGKPRSASMHPAPKVPRLRRPRRERPAA
jgi:hypothetical protein